MAQQISVGQVYRLIRSLNSASTASHTYNRESAILIGQLAAGTGLKVCAVSATPPWAKFNLPGYPPAATLKLSLVEVQLIFGLGTPPTVEVPKGIQKYQTDLERTASQLGLSVTQLNQFLEYWSSNELGFAKKLLDINDTAGLAIKILTFFSFFRKLGVSATQMSRIFILIASMQSPQALKVIYLIVEKGPMIAERLRPLGGALEKFGYFAAAVEVYNYAVKNEWGQATATAYKAFIGSKVPWAGAIDTLQSFFPEVSPSSARMFKVLRACDPVGLGGTGVESFVWMVQSLVDAALGRDFNDARLGQLVNRMKTGPTATFAQIGVRAGDALWEISEMDAQEWKLVGQYTLLELGEFARGMAPASPSSILNKF